MNKLLVINTGGTFNKRYNEQTGTLDVAKDNKAILDILENCARGNLNIDIKGIIFKDSLKIDDKDRKEIINEISKYDKILIVHGTDTMDETAKYIEKRVKDKLIVLTGAMHPYSIDKIEATSNFMIGLSFLNTNNTNGVYISMHGLVKEHEKLFKNRDLGIFQCQK
ncbi:MULTISPECIES: asparaginase domain-containing protein [Malaciobacter]|jgi:L-asparaginase|uniref:L-asparaginase n=2 Tax=Malaciobacter TaxID=2321114 RepID=A0AB36ZX73_9BACT|nr:MULTISPECIES: asparaginase domain-containing protein [Malaciobacter]PHO09367.1 asparaginase [Malaciobacter canalis]PPK62295.1 L-asparaginase [Malaciobacter marinus]QEE32180.1 asparaginase [Malaciobacter canalis]